MYPKLTAACAAAACGSLAGAILANPGFEVDEEIGEGHPSVFSDWSGDTANIVEAMSGVTPFEGEHMLRFIETTASGPTELGRDSDVIQLFSVEPFQPLISTGKARLNGSYWVNRMEGTEDNSFLLRMRSYEGSPVDFHDNIEDFGAETVVTIASDADPGTWEQITASMLVPTETDYVAFWIGATENVINNSTSPEFPGHFADAASLAVVPEPATFAALGLGALALLRRRKKR